MAIPGPKNYSVQEMGNLAHQDEEEIVSPTPNSYDTTRKGVNTRFATVASVRTKNTGPNAIDVQVQGSIDGVDFDVSIQPSTTVAPGNSNIVKVAAEVHKRLRVLVKNTVAGQASSAKINTLTAAG